MKSDIWKRNRIKQELERGNFELDKIVEYTDIPPDKALEIYISIEPDPPKEST